MKAPVTILVCLTLSAAAAEIVLPASALERENQKMLDERNRAAEAARQW